MPGQPTSHLAPVRGCDRCRRHAAVYRNRDCEEELCLRCAHEVAGEHHKGAVITRDMLSEAIAELVVASLGREAIDALVDGEIEGKSRPFGPDNAHQDNPWPWVTQLMEPLA